MPKEEFIVVPALSDLQILVGPISPGLSSISRVECSHQLLSTFFSFFPPFVTCFERIDLLFAPLQLVFLS
jgi:hypothetical protein